MRPKAVEILTTLRAAGFAADVDLVGRGPSKNLDYANTVGARFAVLVGEKELKGDAVAVRDLKSGKQEQVSLETLVDSLRRT
jgi:histidyl-tRNA synthetase